MKRLVIIDGNSLIHRAYHALPPLSAPNGDQVNAVYGFTAMLLRVLQELKPEYIAMTFDLPGPTFRHAQYTAYKANRPAADGELVPQFQKVREVTKAFNIPIFELSGYEADDLVGTLALQAKTQNENLEVVIVSGDMDTTQLVDETTKVYAPKKGISEMLLYDIAGVKARYGFGPERVIDFKGLKGDPSDNIPGVPGIGDKTAQSLIEQFGSLEEILENVALIPGKVSQKLQDFADQATLSKTLATIDCHAPIKLELEQTKVHDFDRQKVLDIFHEYDFRSLVSRLDAVFPVDGDAQATVHDEIKATIRPVSQTNSYAIIDTPEALAKLIGKLQKAKEFAFDTETTSHKPVEAKLVGFSIAYRAGEAFYLPYTKALLDQMQPILEDPTIKKIGHNIKFDALVLENHGVILQGYGFDTMIASWLANPGGFSHGLKSVAYQELGVTMQEITELIGRGQKQISMADVPVTDVANYACADADMTYRLYTHLLKKLKANNVMQVFTRYEMPLIRVLAQMERNGVLVDTKYLAVMSEELGKTIDTVTKEIYLSIGHEFNINSPKQLAEILFEDLKLPAVTKTKTGYSTDEAVLKSLKGAHPIIEPLLTYRELTKLKSTYIDALPTLVNAKTGRLHTSFNQTGAASGRLSSSDPNLQNIPIKSELGAKIREAFVAPKGSVIASLDYSQIELRILAHLSQDPVLVNAYKRGQDVHTLTASVIYGITEDKVTPQMRRSAKTINFALMYGMSAFGLAQAISIPRADAQAFIDRYFASYAGVKKFFEQVTSKAYQEGFVETISGRRRYIPELHSSIPNIRRAGERMAINLPMQGTNADIIKLAMIEIQDYLNEKQFKTKMMLQVHDELVFEIPKHEVQIVIPPIRDYMVNAVKLSVPIAVECKIGNSWGKTSFVTDDELAIAA